MSPLQFLERLELLLQQMIEYQQQRVKEQAQRIRLSATDEDLLQPHDYKELHNHPRWNYEDGVLAGIRSVQMAIRAEIRQVPDTQP